MAEAAATPLVFWIVIGIYLVFLAVAGIRAKGKTHTFEDFMVAGRKIGPILLGLSFGVTYFSAVMIVGGGFYSWLWGLSAIWIAIADTLIGVFFAFLFLGKRTMRMSELTGSLTTSEMLGKRYQSNALRYFTAIVTLIFETIYLVSIYMGLSILLAYAMPDVPIETSYMVAVILCGVITVVYLNVGGAHGAITTDVVEAIIMLVGVVSICIAGIVKVGGITGLVNGLNAIDPTGGLTTAPPGVAAWGWVGYILVTSLGVWGMPQLITRYFTTKKKSALKWGLVISVFWSLVVSLFAWWNGAIGRLLSETNPDMFIEGSTGPDMMNAVVPAMSNLLLGVFAPVFVAAVTAASLTTGEKVIMVASSAFARDFYQPVSGCNDKTAWRLTQVMNTLIVLVAVLLALFPIDTVLALCMFAWAAIASTVLVPYLFGLFWKKGTKEAAIISGIIALIVAVFWKVGVRGLGGMTTFLGMPTPFMPDSFRLWGFDLGGIAVTMKDTHEFIASQVIAFISFPIVSLLTQKSIDKEFVGKLFENIKSNRPVEMIMNDDKPEEPKL